MAAIATITLADAAGTPVNHDFDPSQIDGDLASYQCSDANTIAAGLWNVGVSLREPTGASKVYRSQISMAMPIELISTDTGGHSTTSIGYTLRANLEFILPDGCTLQNRKDFRKMFYELLNNSQVTDVVENLNHTY